MSLLHDGATCSVPMETTYFDMAALLRAEEKLRESRRRDIIDFLRHFSASEEFSEEKLPVITADHIVYVPRWLYNSGLSRLPFVLPHNGDETAVYVANPRPGSAEATPFSHR